MPCTFTQKRQTQAGSIEVIERKTRFVFRRQTQAEADAIMKQAMLNEQAEQILTLKRFSTLLVEAPEGFADFPKDSRPLSERAYDYFHDDQLIDVLRVIMLQYDRALYPTKLLRAFRMVAWQMQYFSEQWSESLGPAYYCQICFRREKDLANGCPKCELTYALTVYKEYAANEIKEAGGFPAGWTIDSLVDLHGLVCGILKRNQDQISGEWDTAFAMLAMIVQQERGQYEFGVLHKQKQQLKALQTRR